jgi:hypothetical protein
MIKCLIVLTSLFSAAAAAVPAWTWVDEQGRRHYSDQPVPGATQIDLPTSQTFGSSASRTQASQTTSQSPQAVAYSVLDVVEPAAQSTHNDIGGNLPVEVVTYPALQSGHRIDAVLDSNYVNIGSRNLDFTLADVSRGEHTLQVVIVDADGNELRRSMPVTFFVRQTSTQTPPPPRGPLLPSVPPTRPQPRPANPGN